MARKQPVPEFEKAIGSRLRSFRETKMISQTAFALHAGISRENLAKYEFGLVPLPYMSGEALCQAHDISQSWLAFGTGPLNPFLPDIHRNELAKSSPRMLFSAVYRDPRKIKGKSARQSEAILDSRIIIMAYRDAVKSYREGKMAEPLFRAVEARALELKKALEESLQKK